MTAKACPRGTIQVGNKCYKQTFDILIKADIPWAEAHKLRDAVSVTTFYPVVLSVSRTFKS